MLDPHVVKGVHVRSETAVLLVDWNDLAGHTVRLAHTKFKSPAPAPH